jgi:ethanolamine ammonia-lyase large subunit
MNAAAARRLFVLANAFKEGDVLVGGTRDDQIRNEARRELLAASFGDIRRTVFVEDGISDAIERDRDRRHDGELDALTIGAAKDILLGPGGPAWVRQHRSALPSEIAAALAKVMSDDELAHVAGRIFNPVAGRRDRAATGGIVIGGEQHFGSRIQPNSAGDDEEEILFSILEGLSCGCGDVIIGLNPAADELDTIVRLEELLQRVVRRLDLPTRYCVLSNIVKQHQAQERCAVDVGFQSLAGTSSALAGMVGLDADGVLDLARSFDGLYFETGQGSAVTNGTAEGIDMVTLEARAYGLARAIQRRTGAWTIVNDVAGFIGPEVFRSPAQLERACLEDLVMAKLHGLTMGLDVCATFHMGIHPDELRAITARVVARGAPAYLMAVAGNADPMLGYLTTAYRDHATLRQRTARRITAAMHERLAALGDADAAQLYALYAKAGGDVRSSAALEDEGRRKLADLRERGLDLGECGSGKRGAEDSRSGDSASGDSGPADARLARIYEHARSALYATIDETVLRDACPRAVRVATRAADREDYLAHPPAGERIRRDDVSALQAAYPTGAPRVQLVVSDGLNANAMNEQLRALLPAVRRFLLDAGCAAAGTDIVVRNGRVRAGYHVGGLIGADAIVHIIGERPGTGLNTISAYLTYGRDEAGRQRWDPQLDHSCTTAVCGIHPRGKKPEAAAAEIARTVARMFEQRRSGVTLR